MVKIGILGDIGSGKSLTAKLFGYPVFDADREVNKIYKSNRSCFLKLKKLLPYHISSYPIKKQELANAILEKKENLKKIVKIVHPIVHKRMNKFFKKNKLSKIIVLDIPLLIENKINKNNIVLVFLDSKKSEINKRLMKRGGYNKKLIDNLRKIQKPLIFKKKMSDYVIKNDFKLSTIKKNVKLIKNQIINERSST